MNNLDNLLSQKPIVQILIFTAAAQSSQSSEDFVIKNSYLSASAVRNPNPVSFLRPPQLATNEKKEFHRRGTGREKKLISSHLDQSRAAFFSH